MKRAIVLAIFAMFVLASFACAAESYFELPTGQNLIAASLVPYDPSPSAVFKTDVGGSMNILNNHLSRFDTASGGFKVYGNGGAGVSFGKIMLGGGYFYKNDTGDVIAWDYLGCPNGVPDSSNKKTDMWISLPLAGANMIGMPFTDGAGIVWANCLMTDGNTTVPVATAQSVNHWWTGFLVSFDPVSGGFKQIKLSGGGTKNLFPYTGYYITTTVPNLALIIPALNLPA